MQRNRSPNTFRDSNELLSTPQTMQTTTEPMDVQQEPRRSIVRPVDDDNYSSNRTLITNRPFGKSIVRPTDNERFPPEASEAHSNETLVSNEHSLAQATGFDSTYVAALDADEAFARELQEAEYSRDSILPNRHHYERFRIPSDDDSPMENASLDCESEVLPHFDNDEAYAAYLQTQEDRRRERLHRQPFAFLPIPTRAMPGSENDEHDNSAIFMPAMHQRPSMNEDEDEDNESLRLPNAHAFFQFLAHQRFGPDGIPPFLVNARRNQHRSGNLQETEDDFGPEDYERLLRLDDSVRKKRLSQHQINAIKEISFHSNSKNTEEENKCGVCLELFEEQQPLRQFPCSHVYHKGCADRWLRENNVCPICRKPPVEVQSTSSSRHHPHHQRSNNNNNNTSTSRRPPANYRNTTSRHTPAGSSSTTPHPNSNNPHNHSRRGPPFQRPS